MSLSCVLVKEVMNVNVATIDLESTVFDACKIMAEKHIGSIIVMDNDKPFGLFTERDLLHIIAKNGELKKIKLSIYQMELIPKNFHQVNQILKRN